MSSHLIPFVVVWTVLVVVVLAMVAWRKAIAAHEDDSLHVSQDGALQQQVSVAQKLAQIDKWGKTLTVIVLVSGLILAGIYLYQTWTAGSSLGV